MNEIRRALRDIGFFAEVLLGFPLWDHQRQVVESNARHRVVCSGRQAGKSTTLAVLALHTAFAKPGAFVLIVSAGEVAARDLLATCSSLAANPLLSGSVVDDSKSAIMLSNGSRIRSVPASTKQVRGTSVDLLIIDEAAFVDEEIWVAAKFSVVAKRDSKIVMASTPWGRQDRFFSVAYRAGLAQATGYESFHWPSTVSPSVDATLIEEWRITDPDRVFRTEVLAEWIDDAGAYFTTAELDAATRDYTVGDWHVQGGVAGVDWGFANDASTLVVLASVGERHEKLGCSRDGVFVAHVAETFRTPYNEWINQVVATVKAYGVRRVASELNGVGQMPTQTLAARLPGRVVGVHTDARSKEDGFGRVKALLQQGRLILPCHRSLLTQLSALEYGFSDAGVMRIAVPERAGHDDLAMALCLAVRADPTFGVARPSGPRVAPRSTRPLRKPSPAARSTRRSQSHHGYRA